jgi:hypothetical protein
MKRILITILKTVLLAVVLFCSFLFLAGFSEAQSLVLTAFAMVFYAELRSRTKQNVPFVPYHVFIEPKLHLMATDFALVEDTAGAWEQIWTEIEKLPKAPWNLWHRGSGFSFSRLSPDLVYNNASNKFATEVNLWASFEPIAIAWIEGTQDHRPLSPALSLAGYRLYIELMTWHWEKIRHNVAFKDIDQERDVRRSGEGGSTVEVHLATIPYREFDPHFVKNEGDGEDFMDRYEQAIKRRAESRERSGWKGKSDDHEGIPANRSNVIEHKYFTLSHSAL